jgi:hypothetical protein
MRALVVMIAVAVNTMQTIEKTMRQILPALLLVASKYICRRAPAGDSITV